MKKIITSTIAALASGAVFAANISLDGTVDVKIKPNNKNFGSGTNQVLQFELPKFKLSEQAKQVLKHRGRQYKANGPQPIHASELPLRVQLGMQGTPVLNQGMHGSCVTFATTAAYDATLGAGDYISQLCNLELGSYLSIHEKIPANGWNGSLGTWVLDQMDKYGVISKNYQTEYGCAGVKEYPVYEELNEGQPMSEAEFKQHSVDIKKLIKWELLLNDGDAFEGSVDMIAIVEKIKEELARGHRVTFGTLLDVNVGNAGAVGSYKQSGDTWMLTPDIIADVVYGNIYAGHEMVITGYDDAAEVYDEEGHSNQGVFTLRNSWSEYAGDNGNYYMTYDHFIMLALEAASIKLK